MNSGNRKLRKVLVTGGAGFIGSHLVDVLMGAGINVVILDDFSTGLYKNIEHHLHNEALTVLEGDCRDAGVVDKAIAGCDTVFHLAARVGVQRVLSSAIATIEDNLNTTRAIAEASLKKGCRLIYSSTSEVYGRNERVPFHESDDLTVGPPEVGRWSYAASKILDEHFLCAMSRERGLEIVIARIFNTAGPRQRADFGMVIPRFIQAASNGETLYVYGNGTQRRCFTWVGDTVNALIGLAGCAEAAGGVFNVGSTEEISIIRLAELVAGMAGNGRIEMMDTAGLGENYADMQRRIPDISKIRELISWNVTLTIREIVQEIMNA